LTLDIAERLFSPESLSALQAFIVLAVARGLQTYITAKRSWGSTNRRFETKVVGITLLLVVLGLYMGTSTSLREFLAHDYKTLQSDRVVFMGFLLILATIFLATNLVGNPARVVYPSDGAHAHLVADVINLGGTLILGSHFWMLTALFRKP
jgi:hypothetical protein